jgi:hypothetical protein
MAIWREAKRLLWKDEAKPVALENVWNEVENPAPRAVEVEAPPIPVKVASPVFVDPWGPVKKPRGALNPLKLVVTVYVLLNLCGAAFLLSNNLTITVTALCVFVPNAAFLMLLRSKL